MYIKKVLHKGRIFDIPCYIDEKIVENFSRPLEIGQIPDVERFNTALRHMDAGETQICVPMLIHRNEINFTQLGMEI